MSSPVLHSITHQTFDGKTRSRYGFQLYIEFQIVNEPRMSKIAGAGNHTFNISISLVKGHNIKFGVYFLWGISPYFQFFIPDPFNELLDPFFNVFIALRIC